MQNLQTPEADAELNSEVNFKVDAQIKGLLKKHFGFDEFRPGQETVIAALMQHGAALAVFPTGGGKSLCYQLPALVLEGVTLVVSPLIALMKDQIDFLQRHGIRAARLDSSLTAEEYHAVANDMRAGTLKLLYVAPERFNNERFLALIRQVKIGLFAIDEAHCISEWGHNFRPDYLKLADTARSIGAERILALTATATPSVVRDICAVFNISTQCAIVTGFYRHNLNIATTPVRASERDALLLKRLHSRKAGPTIIYVTLQKTAESVARLLTAEGHAARAYHAGMESADRGAVQEWWMQGETNIVVATIAFGMGIDKANVRYVYHYNLSKSLESYSQEIGRAGRDDQRATVEMFACPDDVATLENFAYGDMPTDASFRSLLEELLANEGDFDINLIELANRHDLRVLVLRTALTYLELGGVLRQGTPFYAGYAIRPHVPLEAIAALFKGEPARMVTALFENAKKGRTKTGFLYHLNPDDMAALLGQERRRIVRALEVLEEKNLVELTASDSRQRFTVLKPDSDTNALAADLLARFARREEQEIKRLQDVLALVTRNDCQTNALAAHFGQIRDEPCGHCTYCSTGRAQTLPGVQPLPELPSGLDVSRLAQLRNVNPDALQFPRQVARFLCGLTSPALTRARLGRHDLFGVWEAHRFGDVLIWCQKQF